MHLAECRSVCFIRRAAEKITARRGDTVFVWNPLWPISHVIIKKCHKRGVCRDTHGNINKCGPDSYFLCREEYCKHYGVVLFDRGGQAVP